MRKIRTVVVKGARTWDNYRRTVEENGEDHHAEGVVDDLLCAARAQSKETENDTRKVHKNLEFGE